MLKLQLISWFCDQRYLVLNWIADFLRSERLAYIADDAMYEAMDASEALYYAKLEAEIAKEHPCKHGIDIADCVECRPF